jgi:RIO kinase 1
MNVGYPGPPGVSSQRMPEGRRRLSSPDLLAWAVPDVEEMLFPRKKERTEDRRKERAHRDVMDEVFDRATLLAVSRLVSHGFLREVDYSISTGKEANVFRVTTPEGPQALKVYRISNATFRNYPPYAVEELRREVGGGSFAKMIFAWARREFQALKACHEAKVPVPRPVTHYRNLLLMEFVGEEGLPSPPLVKASIEDPAATKEELVRAVRAMTEKAGLVHGDLSPFNVLYHRGHPVIIDMGQTLKRTHPQAPALLRRDATNFARYFHRLGVPTDAEELFEAMGGAAVGPKPEAS